MVYFNEIGKNLAVYGVADSSLKDYYTSKKDVENGLEVNPQE
jgi:serum/glucocorticoid-regulated kinase 2